MKDSIYAFRNFFFCACRFSHDGQFDCFFYFQLSWADFVLAGILETANLFYEVEIEKNYPTVEALVQKIRNLPGVKEYIANRKPYEKV